MTKNNYLPVSLFLFVFFVAAILVFASTLSGQSASVPSMQIFVVFVFFISMSFGVRSVSVKYGIVDEMNSTNMLIKFNIILCINLLAFWFLSSYFFIEDQLLHDTHTFYNNFHNNLHSLNYFGEPAWWYPHVQHGFPGYFLSTLVNVNALAPPFVSYAIFFWICGLFGITIYDFFSLYVWHFLFVTPFIFSLSAWALSSQIVTCVFARYYACVLGAISPALLLNITDSGLIEITAYGFFFIAAFLNFFKKQNTLSFTLFILSSCIVAITAGYAFLAFPFIFILLFFLVFVTFGNSYKRIGSFFMLFKSRKGLIFIVLLGICSAPPLIVKSQQGDLVRTTLYEVESPYQFMSRGVGNPLEPILASTPSVGVKGSDGVLKPFFAGESPGWVFYGYLGVMCLPLLIIGLIASNSIWKIRVFVLSVLYFGVIIFQHFSPLFFPILSANTLLTSISHFNDLTYRSGAFFLLVLLAALGLEAIYQKLVSIRIILFSFLISILFSLYIFIFLGSASPYLLGFVLGYVILFSSIFVISLVWISKLPPFGKLFSQLSGFLILIVFVDLLTVAHLHVRVNFFDNFNWVNYQRDMSQYDYLNEDKIGQRNKYTSAQATTTLQEREYIKILNSGVNLNDIPEYGVYFNFTKSNSPLGKQLQNFFDNGEISISEKKTREAMSNIGLFQKRSTETIASLARIERTYNTTEFDIETPVTGLFFIRDANHIGWSADVNGKAAEIFPIFGHYKGIIIPKGHTKIRLSFSPPFLLPAIVIAYVVIVAIVLSLFFPFLTWKKLSND